MQSSRTTVERNRTVIRAGLNSLDPRDRSPREKLEHCHPIKGRAKVQIKDVLVRCGDGRKARQLTNLSWRAAVSLSQFIVESADTSETGCDCDFAEGQFGFVD